MCLCGHGSALAEHGAQEHVLQPSLSCSCLVWATCKKVICGAQTCGGDLQVLLDGKVVAAAERSCPQTVQLPEVLVFFSQVTVLDIVVHAMGRNSGGCAWDPKGLPYPNIQLNGERTSQRTQEAESAA